MDDRFDVTTVVCIKGYESLKVGSHYRICGRGNLSFIHGTDKKGYGYSIQFDYDWEFFRNTGQRSIYYYFTENEMNEYFITEEEDYKSYLRNEKINKLL